MIESSAVLMVAYHFPPLAGSSGIQRTLRFAQQLPRFGWKPLVLTVHPRAYERVGTDLTAEIPQDLVVHRAPALDTARHLSIGGRYIGAMARPDRWVSWKYGAVHAGMRLIKRYRPRVIWSTFPIATAHLIGAELAQRSKLPWIADFRDPMAQEGYPADVRTWQQYKQIEEMALDRATFSVFTTPGAAREYANRYPGAASRIAVLENGYDEESFAAAEASVADRTPLRAGCTTLLHSGIVYPEERDPTQLLDAVRRLAQSGAIQPGRFSLRFRAAHHDELLRTIARSFGIEDFVAVLPPVGYLEALTEMLRADGLLIMQASNCNSQIPAKAYEYLRSGRPVIGLTDPSGDTAHLLRRHGIRRMAPLNDAAEIARTLTAFLKDPSQGFVPDDTTVAAASRHARTSELADLLRTATRQSGRAASPDRTSVNPAA